MMTQLSIAGTNSAFFGIGFRILAVTVVLAAAGNVQGSHETSQGPEAVGEYLLVSASEQGLPAVVSESGSSRQEVTGGSVRLGADGTSIWRTLYRYTEGSRVSDSESSGRGSYSLRGTSIIFLLGAGADRVEGTLDGERLTIQADVSMVYRKAPNRN